VHPDGCLKGHPDRPARVRDIIAAAAAFGQAATRSVRKAARGWIVAPSAGQPLSARVVGSAIRQLADPTEGPGVAQNRR
jgi:hypothetical protein